MTLQEIKNLELAKAAEARKILDLSKAEKRGLKPEEKAEIDKILGEAQGYRDLYETELRTKNTEAGIKDAYKGQEQRDDGAPPKFKNFGEFASRAIMKPQELRDMGLDDGEFGGFAVPDEFRPVIMTVSPADAIIRPRAMVLPPGDRPDAKVEIPALRQGAFGVYGGVTFTAVPEGTAGYKNDPRLDLITLEPQRISGYVVVGNSLLRNAPAMSAFIENLFRKAKAGYEDVKFIQGFGISEPLGLLNSPAKLNVVRNTSNDIKNVDILAMMALQFGETPFWLANKKTLPKIAALADAVGNSIFIAGDASKKIPPTLYGIPIEWSWRQPTLGTEGDLILVDASYYIIKDGSGPFISSSEHVKFLEDQTAIKMTWWVDGQCWVKAPLLMEDGVSYASPIVALK
jgi:HK97 family phage major capsid protein